MSCLLCNVALNAIAIYVVFPGREAEACAA
jgi:hypothetical protein